MTRLGNIIINTSGNLPSIGEQAPDFELVTKELKLITLKDFMGKNIILSVFPSIDTSTCSISVKHFNEKAAKLKNTVVICASMDSPFANIKFCNSSELSQNLIIGSDIRNRSLGANYGLTIIDSPLAGLLARAVIAINDQQKIISTELVLDIGHEPNYEKVLSLFL